MTISSTTIDRKVHHTFWTLFLLNLTVFALLYVTIPQWRVHFIEEDMFLENLSALTFLLAFLIGLGAIIKPASRQKMPLIAWLIPLLALLGFLDETSFLGLLAGADNPASSLATQETSPLVVFDDYTIDGVHDLFALFFKILNRCGLSKVEMAALMVFFVGLPLFLTRKFYMPRIMKHCRVYPAFNFLRYAIIIIFIAQVFDLGIIVNDTVNFGEELLEFNGGFALVFATIAMWLGLRNEKGITPHGG